MDLANAIMTFLPAAAIGSSIVVRVVKHYRRRRLAAVTRRSRPSLPTHVMYRMPVRARVEPVRWRPEPAEPPPGSRHQHQLEPGEPGAIEPAREPLQLNRLSRATEIALLAVQRNNDGSYRHSANDITKFVGGTAADVKRQIAEIRATKPEKQPEHVTRPPKGWVNSA